MRRFVGISALSAVFLSVGLALAAESPTPGNVPSTTTAPTGAKKTPKAVEAAKVATHKPKVAKAKTPKLTRAAHKAKKNIQQTTPRGTSATPTTSAAGSTQK